MVPAQNTTELVRRIQSEFLEMPGLRLTAKQAHALWGMDEHICQAILEALLASRFLRQTPTGAFLRAKDIA